MVSWFDWSISSRYDRTLCSLSSDKYDVFACVVSFVVVVEGLTVGIFSEGVGLGFVDPDIDAGFVVLFGSSVVIVFVSFSVLTVASDIVVGGVGTAPVGVGLVRVGMSSRT